MSQFTDALLRRVPNKNWRLPFSIEPPGNKTRHDARARFVIRDYDGYPVLYFTAFQYALASLNALEAHYSLPVTTANQARFHYAEACKEILAAREAAQARAHYQRTHRPPRKSRRIGADGRKRQS